MKTVRIKTTFLRLLAVLGILFLLILNTGGGSSALVLCVGEHGHIAVEFAHTGTPHSCENDSDHPPDDSAQHSGCSGEHNTCGQCLDIPLSIHGVDRYIFLPGSHVTETELDAVYTVGTFGTELTGFSSGGLEMLPPLPPHATIFLQSVVLLI